MAGATCFNFVLCEWQGPLAFGMDGQCLTGGKMPKQSSLLSFPKEMTGEETNLEELEFDETDSPSFFEARLCKI